jgi:hypothetical protein
MIVKTQFCQGCKTKHLHSELYAGTLARGGGMVWSAITKPSDFRYNLNIEVLQHQTTVTLFCHECFNPNVLNHLPRQTADEQRQAASWIGSGQGVKAGPHIPGSRPAHSGERTIIKTVKPATKSQKIYTIDDL